MKVPKLTPHQLCEQLMMHFNALRRMGFSADDIYTSPGVLNDARQVCWGTLLRVQGKEWAGSIAPCKKPDTVMQRRWLRYIEEVQSMPDAEMKVLWQKHMPLEAFNLLVISVAAKGIEIPALPEANAALEGVELQPVEALWN